MESERSCCCAHCNCKLEIFGIILASLTSFLQVVTIYLDKYEDEISTAWFPYITMFANAALAGIHGFSIGLKNGKNESSAEQTDVEQSVRFADSRAELTHITSFETSKDDE